MNDEILEKNRVVYRTLFCSWREVEPLIFESVDCLGGDVWRVKCTSGRWFLYKNGRALKLIPYRTERQAMHAVGLLVGEAYLAVCDDVQVFYEAARSLACFSAHTGNLPPIRNELDEREEAVSSQQSAVSKKPNAECRMMNANF